MKKFVVALLCVFAIGMPVAVRADHTVSRRVTTNGDALSVLWQRDTPLADGKTIHIVGSLVQKKTPTILRTIMFHAYFSRDGAVVNSGISSWEALGSNAFMEGGLQGTTTLTDATADHVPQIKVASGSTDGIVKWTMNVAVLQVD